jgi:hypothetical protein
MRSQKKNNDPSNPPVPNPTASGSGEDIPQGHEAPLIFPLDEFDPAGQSGKSSPPPQPSAGSTGAPPIFNFPGTAKPGTRKKKAPPAAVPPVFPTPPIPRGATRRRGNLNTSPRPAKKKGSNAWIFWLCVLGGLYYFGDNKGCSSLQQLTKSVNEEMFQAFRSGKPLIHIDSTNAMMFDPEAGGIDLRGKMIVLGKVSEAKKRYFLPKGIRKRTLLNNKRTKKTSRRTFVGMTENIETMVDIAINADDDILLQDIRDQSLFFVPLGKLEFYEEVLVEVIADNPVDYRNDRKHRIRMPLFLYELALKGEDISTISLEEIPSFKVIEPLEE